MTRSRGRRATALQILDGLERVRVRDDGSCWVYAVLAGFHLLEHAISCEDYRKMKLKMIPDPSCRDRQLDVAIRTRLHEKHGKQLGGEEVLKVPNYELFQGNQEPTKEEIDAEFFGSYGGHEHFAALAVEFGVDIALYNEDQRHALRNADNRWWVFTPDDCQHLLTAQEIKSRMDDATSTTPVLHVALSDTLDNHFEVYRYPEGFIAEKYGSYSLPDWLGPLLG